MSEVEAVYFSITFEKHKSFKILGKETKTLREIMRKNISIKKNMYVHFLINHSVTIYPNKLTLILIITYDMM